MTIAQPIQPPTRPKTRRWTLKEYYRLADLGFFEGQRVELIDGKIYQMPSQNHPHVAALEKSRRVVDKVFGPAHWVRIQAPLHISQSAPEPDLAVVTGSPDDYTSHPTRALLIVEVSDTTLLGDRWKADLYASSGTEDYWIVNIVDRQLEVRRGPLADPGVKRFGHRYSSVTTFSHDQSVAPLAMPGAAIRVADLLP